MSGTTTTKTSTSTSTTRTDVGSGTKFTAPVAENDRDGPQGNAAMWQDYSSMFAMDPWMWGMGYGYTPMLQPDDPWLSEGQEKWGEVEQTTKETLEGSGMVRKYGEDAILVIANGPEDMKQLDQNDEANQIAGSRGQGQQTVVLWNPSKEAMTTMLKEGQFKDVVFSGHGEEGTVYMTGADGEAVAVSGDELAGMFEDTAVQNVFLNVCHGMGGANSVAESLAKVGLNTMGWMGSVKDRTARQGAEAWAALTQDGAGFDDMQAAAAQFAGLGTRRGEAPPAAEPAADPMMDYFDWSSLGYMWV